MAELKPCLGTVLLDRGAPQMSDKVLLADIEARAANLPPLAP